jgi:hypothetical protein
MPNPNPRKVCQLLLAWSEAERVSLDEALTVSERRDDGLLALDEALLALDEFVERKSQVVELRFFCGLRVEETAEAF